MKNIKLILTSILLIITLSIVNVKAYTLTIDDKAYDKSTHVFDVGGSSSFSEVMVSLFDGDELLSFKTVSTSGGKYSASFNITFTEDKKVTIKVGDINSTDYEMTDLSVEKSEDNFINTLTDHNNHSLTILDPLKHFNENDELSLEVITDLENESEEAQNIAKAFQNVLGTKRQIVGFMDLQVRNNNKQVDLEETNGGYKLVLNLDENALKAFTKPCIARITDLNNLTLEEGKELVYSSEENGVAVTLNNVGIYILYDDLSISYKFTDETANPTYNINTDGDLVLKINADLSKFLNLYLNGKLVDKSNYKLDEGSTIITLSKAYLSTLATGTYTLKADYTDGEAVTMLTIKNEVPAASNEAKTSSNPKTSDNITIYMVMFVASSMLIGSTIWFKKKIS